MRTKLFLLLVILSMSVSLNAQDLKESLGGIETNFQFYSDTTNLNVTEQIIIQRAEKKSHIDALYETRWGYGYQSFHLEFITQEQLVEKKNEFSIPRVKHDKLEITFYNSKNIVLTSCTLDYSVVDFLYHSSSGKTQYFYSLDLIDIPILLLNEAVKINLIKNSK